MAKQLPFILFCSLLLTLAGCAYFKSDTPAPSDNDALCASLKRQYYYHNLNPNPEASWVAKSQKEKLKQQLIEHHCGL